MNSSGTCEFENKFGKKVQDAASFLEAGSVQLAITYALAFLCSLVLFLIPDSKMEFSQKLSRTGPLLITTATIVTALHVSKIAKVNSTITAASINAVQGFGGLGNSGDGCPNCSTTRKTLEKIMRKDTPYLTKIIRIEAMFLIIGTLVWGFGDLVVEGLS